MDYTALNEITETIIALLKKAVDDTKNWPPALNVLPELLKDTNEGIGFYLYHVQENSHYKNYPAPGIDLPPVNFTPMSLNLFYQLSANKRKEDNEDAFDEQRLMSVAMKALHDHAIITKTVSTPVNPTGKRINVKITLQNITPSESVQYWSASELPVRLAAYYEASVVFMEPETTKSYSGRVLSYGNYIFVQGTPQIIGSENTIEYNLPGDPVVRAVKISPAQAPPASIIPGPVNSVIRFTGTGFSSLNIKLLVINPRWKEPAVADLIGWETSLVSQNEIRTTVRQTALLETAAIPVDIIPGLYAAQVAVTEVRVLPDSSTKSFRHTSNQFPFSVMPRIDAIAPLTGTPGTLFTVTGYLFQHVDIITGDIQVYIGEDALTLQPGAGPATVSHFRVTGANNLEFRAPLTLKKGVVPVRILIKGVESPPAWITGL